jgi:proteic killer suppression protein
VRIEFADNDLEHLYTEPDFRLPRMGPDLINNFRRKLAVVAGALDDRDLLAMRSLRLEKLIGHRAGQHSIRLNDQWRLILTFRTDGKERVATIVEIVDYH